MIRWLLIFSLLYGLKTIAQPPGNGFFYGRTTGPLPYFEYGLGDDRLGGAKMGYLDTSVLVKVVDSVRDDYKIQLSRYHTAYLPKVNFKTDSSIQLLPFYLTSSWKVYGDDQFDYLYVVLDERLPYRVQQEINPSRIIIDIFGVTSNTNWITQLSSAKEIRNAYYEQREDDVFRVIIELKHDQHWGYQPYYDGKKLVIRVNRQPPVLSLSKLKIAVDAGHGGENMGATGRTSGIAEKDYTLKIARELEKALKKEKAKVYMTREEDTTLSMVDRTLAIRQELPHLLLSIHLNSAGSDTVKGASTYYRHIGFRPLTQAILKRMLELGLKEYGNVGSFNFSLSGPTEYPNCLVEVAFLSNREDEKRILSPTFHKQVAAKIVAGVKDWLKNMPR
ncbi:MAG: N-acetylmuramoyl-L-alanine amidase [Chitinophagaceae bacterium]|nr:N-acetylmuramoyl-L-alanine amidase [Chitinophagaceae bacterium]